MVLIGNWRQHGSHPRSCRRWWRKCHSCEFFVLFVFCNNFLFFERQGTNGITLFYIPVKENGGPINESINLIRLKDKLGTRQLPTAELLLDGAQAYKVRVVFILQNFWVLFFVDQISTEGRGIASISHMLQITRVHNAVSCASYIQRFEGLNFCFYFLILFIFFYFSTELTAWRATMPIAGRHSARRLLTCLCTRKR